MCLLQIVKLAPYMRPAPRFLDTPVFVELIESSVGVSLQRATKLALVTLGMFAFAIRRVGKPTCRRRRIPSRTIISNVRPQPPGLGLAIPRSQYRHGRIVGV